MILSFLTGNAERKREKCEYLRLQKGDFNCRLRLRSKIKYNVVDAYVDKYSDDRLRFIYREHTVFGVIKEEQAAG